MKQYWIQLRTYLTSLYSKAIRLTSRPIVGIELRLTSERISEKDLGPNDVFVFGSNENGYHDGGAAAFAHIELKAKYGMAEGRTSMNSYAIPTLDYDMRQLPAWKLRTYIERFIRYARVNPFLTFHVTEIGCGIAGFSPIDVAPYFQEAIAVPNIKLPKRFWEALLTSNLT